MPSATGATRPVDWETVVVTGGADSRAGGLLAASVVVPPGVTLCLGEAGSQGTGASQDKQLPRSHAPGRGRGSSPRCTHLRIITARPPLEDQLEGQAKSKFLTEQRWEAPGEVEGFTVYRTRGYPSYFFSSFFQYSSFLYQTVNFQLFSVFAH